VDVKRMSEQDDAICYSLPAIEIDSKMLRADYNQLEHES